MSTRPAAEKLTAAAPVLAALGDKTRLTIVAQLCARGPQSIARLTDGTSISRQAVTKHLRRLAKAGLVRSSRQGRERIWRMQTKRLDEVRRYLGQISDQWDEAIGRLRVMVEDEKP